MAPARDEKGPCENVVPTQQVLLWRPTANRRLGSWQKPCREIGHKVRRTARLVRTADQEARLMWDA